MELVIADVARQQHAKPGQGALVLEFFKRRRQLAEARIDKNLIQGDVCGRADQFRQQRLNLGPDLQRVMLRHPAKQLARAFKLFGGERLYRL